MKKFNNYARFMVETFKVSTCNKLWNVYWFVVTCLKVYEGYVGSKVFHGYITTYII